MLELPQKETTDSVLNFNEGLFTKERAGLREPPCDVEAPGVQRLKVLVPLCLSKCRDSGVTRSEENWGPPPARVQPLGEREGPTAKPEWKLKAGKPRMQSKEGKPLRSGTG